MNFIDQLAVIECDAVAQAVRYPASSGCSRKQRILSLLMRAELSSILARSWLSRLRFTAKQLNDASGFCKIMTVKKHVDSGAHG